MPRVLLTPQAEESRLALWRYIAQDSADHADRQIDRIDEKCRRYAHQPLMGDSRPDLGTEVRCFPVDSQVVIYRPLDDGILLLLVIHGARDIPRVFRESFDR